MLDRALKEKWDAEHAFGLKQLWGWFAQYPYLPRLRDVSVLEGAVCDGSSSLLWRSETFAYAAAREASGEYRGIVAGRIAETPVTSTSLIVDGSVLPDPLPGTEDAEVEGLRKGQTTAPIPSVVSGGSMARSSLGDPRRPIPELARVVG